MTNLDTGLTAGRRDHLSDDALMNADAAIIEIFAMMCGMKIEAEPNSPAVESGSTEIEMGARTAIVGLSGALRGICQVRMSPGAAAAVASSLLGTSVDPHDPSVNDAVGELCNMVAGGWKNSYPQLASDCILSPPTVISGGDYAVHLRAASPPLTRAYHFDGHTLTLTLYREMM